MMSGDYITGTIRRVEQADEPGALSFDLERLGQPPLRIQVSALVAEDGYCIPDMPVTVYFDGGLEQVTRVAEVRPW